MGVSSTVAGRTIKEGTPLVKTRYGVPLGLGIIRWGLLSCGQVRADSVLTTSRPCADRVLTVPRPRAGYELTTR